MLRLNVREFFWISICVALAVGWWRSSHAGQKAAIDVEQLPDVAPYQIVCSVTDSGKLPELQKQPVAEACLLITPRIIITEEEEEKLGIDFEEN